VRIAHPRANRPEAIPFESGSCYSGNASLPPPSGADFVFLHNRSTIKLHPRVNPLPFKDENINDWAVFFKELADMEKRRNPKCFWKKAILVFAFAVLFLLPMSIAYANSGPPPSVAWFTFDYKIDQTPKLLGVQLIACTTANCEQSDLLQQFGTCDGEGCIKSQPKLNAWPDSFGCAENICVSSGYYGEIPFKLVAQFSDQVRSTGVIGQLPAKYGETSSWHVFVHETNLTVESGFLPAVANPDRLYPKLPIILFGLSILVEIVVAGLCFFIGIRSKVGSLEVRGGNLENKLLIVLLVNLVSLPVVWFFFPSMGRFQLAGNQNRGVMVFFLALVFTALLAGIYHSEGKTRGWLIALMVISLALIGFCSPIILSFTNAYGFGDYVVNVQGLSPTAIIIASEIFAVAYEGFMMMVMSKKSIPVKLIWITSLLMNAASFIAGLIFTG
jgi:hypothetical protein